MIHFDNGENDRAGFARVAGMTFIASRYANIFPMMDDVAFERLKQSIDAIGLREPLLVNGRTNALVDGRNRARALSELGIAITEAMVRRCDLTDAQEREEVVRLNNRRDMTASQRSVSAIELQRLAEAEGLPLTKSEIASMFGVSPRQLAYAEELGETAPDLVQPVKDRVITVHGARQVATLPIEDQRAVKDAIATGDKAAVAASLKSAREKTKRNAAPVAQPIAGGVSKPLSGERSHLKFGTRDTRLSRLNDVLCNVPRLEPEVGELAGLIKHGALAPGALNMLKALLNANWSPEILQRVDRAVAELRRAIDAGLAHPGSAGAVNCLGASSPVTALLPPPLPIDRSADGQAQARPTVSGGEAARSSPG